MNNQTLSVQFLTVITRLESFLMLAQDELSKGDDCDTTPIEALIHSSRREVGELCILIDQPTKRGEMK